MIEKPCWKLYDEGEFYNWNELTNFRFWRISKAINIDDFYFEVNGTYSYLIIVHSVSRLPPSLLLF
jgi:hypothetical protein